MNCIIQLADESRLNVRLTAIFQDNLGKPVPECLYFRFFLELRVMEAPGCPQGNQELFVVRQSWKTPGEHGVSKSVECDIFPCSPLSLLVG